MKCKGMFVLSYEVGNIEYKIILTRYIKFSKLFFFFHS